MDGFSILQLTSLTTVVSAAIFLTYVAKRALADVPVASRVPVWIYTAVIASLLTYVASRVTGTLEGQTGVLMIDAVINGALASGIREWFTTSTKPLAQSSTAQEAVMDKEIAGRMSRGWLLPILLVGTIGVSGCGLITIPPQVPPTQPTEAQVQAIRAKAIEIAGAVEKVGVLVLSVQQQTEVAAKAGLITAAQRDVVYQLIIDLAPRVVAVVDIASTVTTEPQLRTAVQALVGVVTQFLSAMQQTGHPALAEAATAIRAELDIAFVFVGGDQ